MASNRRSREVARAKAERQRKRREERAVRRRRTQQIVAAVTVLVLVIAGVTWFALSRSGSTDADGGTPVPTPTLPTPTPTEPTPSPTQPSPSPTGTGQPVPDCATPPAPRPDDLSYPDGPEQVIQTGSPYTLTFATNCGSIVIETEPAAAPETVNSMVFLAEQGYFDLTSCHRLTTAGIFVLQCGDPAGDGMGGPGYSVPDENLPAEGADNYPVGTVAMANRGPGTSGSQFFIVYENTTLPASYTIWGKVTEGLDIVRAVAAAGVTPGPDGPRTDGPPLQAVVVEQATVGNGR